MIRIIIALLISPFFFMFVMGLLDCLGVVDFWRVKYGDRE